MITKQVVLNDITFTVRFVKLMLILSCLNKCSGEILRKKWVYASKE